MVYVRKKRINGNEYWYASKSKRVKGKVKQKTVAYIGPCRKISYGEAQKIAREKSKGI
ncbi:MAG: hypothetical protein ACOCT9_01865 [archaeon]